MLETNQQTYIVFAKNKIDFKNIVEKELSLQCDYLFNFEKITHKEARQINEILSLKVKKPSVFCFFTKQINHVSQDILLKSFEEPGKNKIVILGTKESSNIKETLASRAQIIKTKTAKANSGFAELLTLKNRLDSPIVKKIIKEKDKETAKDILAFFLDVAEKKPMSWKKKNQEFLKDFLEVYELVKLSNQFPKQQLEAILLLFPQD